MNAELTEFDRWSAEWRAEAADAPVSLDKIRGRVRRYAWLAVADWLMGAALIIVMSILTWRDARPEMLAGLIAVWGFVIVTIVSDYRYRRGTWRAAGSSTRDFLELARNQLIARLRSLRLGLGILAGEVVFFLFWIPWVVSGKEDPGPLAYVWAFGWLASLVAFFAIGIEWLRRRTARQLEQLDAERESLLQVEPG